MSQRELRRRLIRLEASRSTPACGPTASLLAERDAIVARHVLTPDLIAQLADDKLEDALRALSAGGDPPPWLLRLQAINARLGSDAGSLPEAALEAAFAGLTA